MTPHYLLKTGIFAFIFAFVTTSNFAQERTSKLLDKEWKFSREDDSSFADNNYDDSDWKTVNVPHDWAIYGPFSKDNDPQKMAIVEDGQTKSAYHLARTGGLPFVGTGWYRREINAPDDIKSKTALLQFDGAMSHAQVYINGQKVGQWPYGYNSFYFDVTDYLNPGKNQLAVRLENPPESSRWYPGAGLYRNVHLFISHKTKIAHWGTAISTEKLKDDFAKIKVKTQVKSPDGWENLKLKTSIIDTDGNEVAEETNPITKYDELNKTQHLIVENPKPWSPENPHLYTVVSKLYKNDKLRDVNKNRFGIRTIKVVPKKGFYLNGKNIQFKGVNMHHDLGPLGAAVNMAAIKRQIRIMKDMGVNAIRTSHNMPAPELVEACDEMGMMLMAETFDEWKIPKMKNGYNTLFDDWAEKDIVNEVHHFRNSPSIVMWSIGNEIPEQNKDGGAKVARFLQDIFHREDPTRPVTQGMNNPEEAIKKSMAATMDIPGINYHTFTYQDAYKKLPQEFILATETVSTFSSRGVYKFPVKRKQMAKYDDLQASSYDVEHAAWSNVPEDNFIYSDDLPYMMGEFVWTGFDYLGEPTPYYTEWPSHSSLFGAVDLAGIPKDRFYLYRSEWNTKENTLHILPHWTWPKRKGKTTPIFVYTNYPSAEVFINGKSQGIKKKDPSIGIDQTENKENKKNLTRLKRYRLMWMNTKYEPGTVKVVAYDKSGNPVKEDSVTTAGKPHHLDLKVDRDTLNNSGKDLAFVTVTLVDKADNPVPNNDREISIKVHGKGHFKAIANGDPTNIESFQEPHMKTFNGKLVAIVKAGEKTGTIKFKAKVKGLKSAKTKIEVSKQDN